MSHVTAHLLPIKTAAKLIFLTCGIMPKVDRLASQIIDIMTYPHVSVNCTVQLERLDPAMLQTPKKEKKENIGKEKMKSTEMS
jgi:hypothetical protein